MTAFQRLLVALAFCMATTITLPAYAQDAGETDMMQMERQGEDDGFDWGLLGLLGLAGLYGLKRRDHHHSTGTTSSRAM